MGPRNPHPGTGRLAGSARQVRRRPHHARHDLDHRHDRAPLPAQAGRNPRRPGAGPGERLLGPRAASAEARLTLIRQPAWRRLQAGRSCFLPHLTAATSSDQAARGASEVTAHLMKRTQLSFLIVFALLLMGASAAQAASRRSAEARTAGYLDTIRTRPAKLRAFLKAMPKGADLHNHLSG